MKRIFFILVIPLVFFGCAKSNPSEQTAEKENVPAVSIALPETHLNVFGVSMGLMADDFSSELSTIFHDTIETQRKWWKSSMEPQKVINVCGLPFACQIDTFSDLVAKVTLTSPTIAIDGYDQKGVDAINQLIDSLSSIYGGSKNPSSCSVYRHGHIDRVFDNGWVKFTWDGCCAVSYCEVEFIDRGNMLLSLLQTTDVANIVEDTFALGHFYEYDARRVLDVPHGFYLCERDSDLTIVPQYRGGDYLQKQFGKSSYYKARVKNSQYPYLEFPKDKSIEYNSNKEEMEFLTADSSTVVVRAWQLPDSVGYLYYVAHQDTYMDMLPMWTTLIYSPTSLSKKFIHKNYKVEYFWPSDMRY